MSQSGQPSSRAEKWTGSVILLCLAAVTGGVFLKQYSFNPAVLVARHAAPTQPAQAKSTDRPAWLSPELKIFGRPEQFSPDNLYDKIDGKAELYLSAGFVRLNCQRFALKRVPDQWLEWFVYNMGTVPQAFSVFTVQRRAEGQPLDLAEYAYQTKNAVFFVSGSNYVEAVASSTNRALMEALQTSAKNFVSANISSRARLTQLDLLPKENLVPGSYALQTADVFGFARFKNVYTAQYKVGDNAVLGFVMTCSDASTATALRDAYRTFLLANGGKAMETSGSTSDDPAVNIMDTIEIVFSEGPYVAGVHSAPNVFSARRLASELRQHLSGNAK